LTTPAIDFSAFKTPPFKHQKIGVEFLVEKPEAALFDEMGSGKSYHFINVACVLYEAGLIDTLLIVCPGGVISTWAGRENGEIILHSWIQDYVQQYSTRNTRLRFYPGLLHYIVTNYEFIRNKNRYDGLVSQIRGRKVMIVFDESSYITSHKAAQSKASRDLRQYCSRAYLANGTPINNNLIDLYTPFGVLNKKIIGVQNWYAFRNRYCVLGGFQNKQIIGYRNVEELQRKLKPYILRRLKADCLDLPPKLYNAVEVPLENETWRIYKQLRDETITWLDSATPIMTVAAIVKIVRLSQVTSGMIGGMKRSLELVKSLGLADDTLFQNVPNNEEALDEILNQEDIRVISSEKHDWAAEWNGERIQDDPEFRVIFWTRFRKEQELLAAKLQALKKAPRVLHIMGGQKKTDREETISMFNSSLISDPVSLIGQVLAGGIGTNLQHKCNWAVYVSNDYSLKNRLQSEDRIHRSGQLRSSVNYIDLLATGPNGQRTIDHAVRRTLMKKDEFATNTTAFWRAALLEE